MAMDPPLGPPKNPRNLLVKACAQANAQQNLRVWTGYDWVNFSPSSVDTLGVLTVGADA